MRMLIVVAQGVLAKAKTLIETDCDVSKKFSWKSEKIKQDSIPGPNLMNNLLKNSHDFLS